MSLSAIRGFIHKEEYQMAWLHGLHAARFLFIGFFSLTALSLITFQSIAMVQAFIDFFEVFRRK